MANNSRKPEFSPFDTKYNDIQRLWSLGQRRVIGTG